jgi:PadR family transcriptional regulator AphA
MHHNYCTLQYCQGVASTKDLTTTSYALLGLLAIEPWSAYELAKQMKRGFPWYWPRAERAIYAEPKNLVAHGLATAEAGSRGRQSRTVYAITPAGRKALRAWQAQPSALPRFESEALVRLTFLEHGSPGDAVVALASLREAASEIDAIVARVSGEYLAGRGPFPERLPQVALTGSFIAELATMFRTYADWAEEHLAAGESGDAATLALERLAELNARTASIPT